MGVAPPPSRPTGAGEARRADLADLIPHEETLGPLRLHHLQSAPTSSPELGLTVYAPADETTRAPLATI